ncbi:Actin- protein 6 [Apophysomyces ossiformis]|uniref:Actin-like protein ARP6 n=1 Tax=Apophysomyces ossiformis TaxID=679940 RepID=A0A8H7BRB2_9FUNG|nr:Actin- protein 6 [Apophysomyces ossiformis]
MAPTVILDNGASTMKVGLDNELSPRFISNAIIRGRTDRRHFIGDQLDQCTDFSSLFYRLPFEKVTIPLLEELGINFFERTIWDRLFKDVLKIDTKGSRLLITEPCFNLPAIQEAYDQIVFEEYEFASCYRTIAPLFDGKPGSIPDCALIVDSGFSFTHIVPFLKGTGIRRINVGGKLLTNQLKETVSFRHYDMMEETHIINEVKETCCFVSQDVFSDLQLCKRPYDQNPIVQEYVLPDFTNRSRGHIRPKQGRQAVDAAEQVLPMNNERFMIPEILMHPSDIGLQQAGIPEAIVESVDACDAELRGLLFANVVLVGGSAKFPGYQERIADGWVSERSEKDLRQLVPSEYEIRVAIPPDPVGYAWTGGQRLVSLSTKTDLQKKFVHRKDYMEYGSEICRRKFGSL